MYRGQTVFSQLMQFVPWMAFSRIVTRYSGDRGVRNLNCAQQFRAMAFAQLTRRRSLRDLSERRPVASGVWPGVAWTPVGDLERDHAIAALKGRSRAHDHLIRLLVELLNEMGPEPGAVDQRMIRSAQILRDSMGDEPFGPFACGYIEVMDELVDLIKVGLPR